jgi:cytochrome P450
MPPVFCAWRRDDIDRSTPEKKETYPKFAYFAFSSGSHVCIGEHFATMEAIILLSSLLQHWRFEPAFEGPLPYRSTMSMRPSNRCPVYIRKRSC